MTIEILKFKKHKFAKNKSYFDYLCVWPFDDVLELDKKYEITYDYTHLLESTPELASGIFSEVFCESLNEEDVSFLETKLETKKHNKATLGLITCYKVNVPPNTVCCGNGNCECPWVFIPKEKFMIWTILNFDEDCSEEEIYNLQETIDIIYKE